MELQPKKPTVKGPADWFTGDVWIDAVAEGHAASPFGAAFVHFTPGARTAWHSHSVGQILYVTEGEGRVPVPRPIGRQHPCRSGCVRTRWRMALAWRYSRPLDDPPGHQ